MNVTCTNCGKRYLVADEKVAGKASAKIRCRQCGAIVSVADASRASAEASPQSEGAAAADAAATAGTVIKLPTVGPSPTQPRSASAAPVRVSAVRPAVMPPSDSSHEATAIAAFDPGAVWFAMIAGAQVGPIDLLAVAGRAARGEIGPRTYVWQNGMADWKRASDVPEVLEAITRAKSPPPPPTPPAPAPLPLQRPEGAGGVPKTTTPMHPTAQQALLLAHQKTTPSFRRVPASSQGRPSAALQATPQAAPRPAAASPGIVRLDHPDADVGFDVVDEEAVTISRPSAPRGPAAAAARAPTPAPQPRFDLQATLGPAPTFEPEPALQPATDDGLDVDLDGEGARAGEGTPDEASSHAESDPFASIAQSSKAELAPPGEATRFFINQAGVNKRNPPWKIALFVLGLIGGPVGLLYLLSTLKLVELPTVPRTTEDGQVVQETFFSPSGMSGLKDLLTGEGKRRREEAEAKAAAAAKAKAAAEERERERLLAAAQQQPAQPERGLPGAGTAETANLGSIAVKPEDLKGLYEEAPPGSRLVVPKTRAPTDAPAVAVNSGKGLSPEAIAKVVGDKQKAFNACIDRALRRNPRLSVGSITVVLNVATSGVVTSASVRPASHADSDWAQCMVAAGRRIVFPTSGEETVVEVPFKIGVAISP